jgi:ribosome-associated protein
MIEITPNLHLSDDEVQMDYVRASGPGGQNVNKVSTSVHLRFDVRASPSLQPDVKERLIKLAGNRVTDEGVLLIEARQYRTQEQNRYDAIQRLVQLVRAALVRPKIRRPTRPTATAKAARVGAKKRHGEIKRTRRFNPEDWE